MKKLFILIALIATTNSYSQEPELFNTTWYLNKVIIDNEEYRNIDYTPWIGIIEFSEEDENIFVHICEQDSFWATFQFDTNNIFILSDYEPNIFPMNCPDYSQEYLFFRDLYFSVFYEYSGNAIFKNPFTYTIETDGDNYMLTIENAEGDIAVYGNVALSVAEHENTTFVLYPNPVADILTVGSKEPIVSVMIYDIQGKQIHRFNFNDTTVKMDVSSLQNGIYFVKVETEDGSVGVERFIKKF